MGKTATIATKVTTETLAALELMAHRRRTSVYDLVLSAIVMLLRIGGKKQALSPRMKESWHAFEHLYGALSSANIATLKQKDLEIQDAVYRVTQKGKKQPTLIYMSRPFFGESVVSQNNEDIVALVMKTAYPSTYNMLKEVQEQEGLPSMMGAISHLLHMHYGQMMEEQIGELFGDNERAENNRNMKEQQPYVRKNNKTIYSKQIEFAFDDEQGQELSKTDRQHEVGEALTEDEGI